MSQRYRQTRLTPREGGAFAKPVGEPVSGMPSDLLAQGICPGCCTNRGVPINHIVVGVWRPAHGCFALESKHDIFVGKEPGAQAMSTLVCEGCYRFYAGVEAAHQRAEATMAAQAASGMTVQAASGMTVQELVDKAFSFEVPTARTWVVQLHPVALEPANARVLLTTEAERLLVDIFTRGIAVEGLPYIVEIGGPTVLKRIVGRCSLTRILVTLRSILEEASQ